MRASHSRTQTLAGVVNFPASPSSRHRQLEMSFVQAPVDLSALVTETLPELRRHVPRRVRIETHLAARLPLVDADGERLRRALTGLVENACHGMPTGGTLSIVTDVASVGSQMQRLRPWLRSGRFVRLEMADSGRGVNTPSLKLWDVSGVIRQSNGFIWAEGEPGQGTRVTILLPVSSSANTSGVYAEARARVLLVEDDEQVREMLDRMLMHHGFSVSAYENAEDALDHDAPFDLLLTDVGLPGLNGPSLAREIKRRDPGVPVLLMSGDPGHVGEIEEPYQFLHKPFSCKALVSSVQQLLSA